MIQIFIIATCKNLQKPLHSMLAKGTMHSCVHPKRSVNTALGWGGAICVRT